MRVAAQCIKPIYFHLVPRPANDGDLGAWMQWLMTARPIKVA